MTIRAMFATCVAAGFIFTMSFYPPRDLNHPLWESLRYPIFLVLIHNLKFYFRAPRFVPSGSSTPDARLNPNHPVGPVTNVFQLKAAVATYSTVPHCPSLFCMPPSDPKSHPLGTSRTLPSVEPSSQQPNLLAFVFECRFGHIEIAFLLSRRLAGGFFKQKMS